LEVQELDGSLLVDQVSEPRTHKTVSVPHLQVSRVKLHLRARVPSLVARVLSQEDVELLGHLDRQDLQLVSALELLLDVFTAFHGPVLWSQVDAEVDIELLKDVHADLKVLHTHGLASALAILQVDSPTLVVLSLLLVVEVIDDHLEGFVFLLHLGSLVLLLLVKTDVAEEDSVLDVDVVVGHQLSQLRVVDVEDDGDEDTSEEEVHKDLRDDEDEGFGLIHKPDPTEEDVCEVTHKHLVDGHRGEVDRLEVLNLEPKTMDGKENKANGYEQQDDEEVEPSVESILDS